MNINIAADLKKVCTSDEALTSISDKVLLVSSKQLSKILGKKNDNSIKYVKIIKINFMQTKFKKPFL